jgi:hypothetical protein
MNATGKTITPTAIILNASTPGFIIRTDNMQCPPLQKRAPQRELIYYIPTPFPPPVDLRPRSTTLLKRVSQRTQALLARSTRLLTAVPQRIQMLLSIMLFASKPHIGTLYTRPLFKAVPQRLNLQLGTVPKVHGVLKVVAPTLLTITAKSKAVKHKAVKHKAVKPKAVKPKAVEHKVVEHKATDRLLEVAPQREGLNCLLQLLEDLGCRYLGTYPPNL